MKRKRDYRVFVIEPAGVAPIFLENVSLDEVFEYMRGRSTFYEISVPGEASIHFPLV